MSVAETLRIAHFLRDFKHGGRHNRRSQTTGSHIGRATVSVAERLRIAKHVRRVGHESAAGTSSIATLRPNDSRYRSIPRGLITRVAVFSIG